MSWKASSRGDQGKAPVYTTSHKNDSSNDETALADEQVARVLQSHFHYKGDDPKPTGGIPIETHSWKRRSVETAYISFESHIVSSRASL